MTVLPPCPPSIACTCSPLDASQTTTRPSSPPDATRVPSPEKATDLTGAPPCPPSIACTCSPLDASQTTTRPSPPPDATRVPSPEKATEQTVLNPNVSAFVTASIACT